MWITIIGEIEASYKKKKIIGEIKIRWMIGEVKRWKEKSLGLQIKLTVDGEKETGRTKRMKL